MLLVLSSLCDLEVKNQPEPLAHEPQKNDIVAPGARKLAFGHRFVSRARPMNAAAHRVQFPANRARVHRRLGNVRRRYPVYRRTADDSSTPDDGTVVKKTDEYEDANGDVAEVETEVQTEGGSEEGSGTEYGNKEEGTEDAPEGGDEDGNEDGAEDGLEEETYDNDDNGIDDETYEGPDEGYGEDDGADVVSAEDTYCPNLRDNGNFEAAAERIFSNNSTTLNDDVLGLDKLAGDLDIIVRGRTEDLTLTVGQVQDILIELIKLKKFKEALCGNTEVSAGYLDEQEAAAEEAEEAEAEGNRSALPSGSGYDDPSLSSGDVDPSPPSYGTSDSDLSDDQPSSINQETPEDIPSVGDSDSQTSSTNDDGTTSAVRRARQAQIHHLNAIHRNRLMRAKVMKIARRFWATGRSSQLIRGDRRGNVVRRHLAGVPTRRVVFRPHLNRNVYARPHYAGQRIVRPIRRAAQRVVRTAGGQRRVFVNRFHRYV